MSKELNLWDWKLGKAHQVRDWYNKLRHKESQYDYWKRRWASWQEISWREKSSKASLWWYKGLNKKLRRTI